MEEIIKELYEFSELENDDLSECIQALCFLYRREGFFNKGFYKELLKELKSQHKNYKKNCVIVEREETITRTVKELVWRI